MLLLEITLVPGVIALVTVVADRRGSSAGGWLGSLPVVAGPILLVMALEQGPAFASQAARAATLGTVSLAAFLTTYTAVAAAGLPWWVALAGGWSAFAAVTLLVHPLSMPPVLGFIGAVAAARAGRALLALLPNHPRCTTPTSPVQHTLLRMMAGTVLVLVLTAAAARIGPTLSGLVSTFPVIASVLAAFTHGTAGTREMRGLADSLLRGLPSFAVFTTVVSLTLSGGGIVVAFLAATLSLSTSHALLISRHRRKATARSRG